MAYTPSIVGQYATRMGRPRNIWEALSNVSNLASVYFGEKQERDYLQEQDAQKRQFDIADTLSAFERQKQLIEFQNSMKPPKVETTPEEEANRKFRETDTLMRLLPNLPPLSEDQYYDLNNGNISIAYKPKPSQQGGGGGEKPLAKWQVDALASDAGVYNRNDAMTTATRRINTEAAAQSNEALTQIAALISDPKNDDLRKAVAKATGVKKEQMTADASLQLASKMPIETVAQIMSIIPKGGTLWNQFNATEQLRAPLANADSTMMALNTNPESMVTPAQGFEYPGYFNVANVFDRQAQAAPDIKQAAHAELMKNPTFQKLVSSGDTVKINGAIEAYLRARSGK